MRTAWAFLVAVDLLATYVCFMKGKRLLGWIGVLAVLPPLTYILVVVPVIGAITPGRANPEEAQPQPLPPPSPQIGDSPVQPQQATPTSVDGSDIDRDGLTRATLIGSFLRDALVDGTIDEKVYRALRSRLKVPPPETRTPTTRRPSTVVPPPKSAPVVPPARPVVQKPPLTAPRPPAATPSRPERPPVSRPSPERKPKPALVHKPDDAHTTAPVPEPIRVPEPPTPQEPSRLAVRRAELWDAFTSDVAVHGLVYLGVLLTFASVLGFMLFAFADLPIESKPFVELLIALTFFGWAWILNLQNAKRVAQAMELLGGMILPLVWYAALVDSAGVPPDAEGRPLVLALVVSSLVLSALYWLVSRRFRRSMLRFLVWPMVWVAAMGIGFVFKTDEHLVGDAITRLVAPQPALASIAIAASLCFLSWRPTTRLTGPTFTAALVGVPSAYLLTFGLSLTDGFSVSWPILVSGLGTVVSIELVSHRFGWQENLRSLRPYVYALVGVPLVVAIGVGWGGAIVAVGYVVLAEIAIRSPKTDRHDITSAAAGAFVGLVLSLTEPGATVVAFGTVSIWSHLRRRIVLGDTAVTNSLAAAAALAPIGVVYGMFELLAVPLAFLIMGGLILSAAGFVRVRSAADDFDSIWFPSAATALGVGALVFWIVDGTSALAVAATLCASGLTVSFGQRWPTGNLWLGAALFTSAVVVAFDALGVSGAGVAAAWSTVGVLTIMISIVTRGGSRLRIAPGHFTALGHVIGVIAFTVSMEPYGFSVAMSGWAIGWVISFLAFERKGNIDPVAVWKSMIAPDHESTVTVEEKLALVTPVLAATSVLAAVMAIFVEAMHDTGQLGWIGPTFGFVSILYALLAVWGLSAGYGRVVFTQAAAITAVAGVGLSYSEPWATLLAASAVVTVRILLMRIQHLPWLTWAAWLMPAVATTAFAAIAGVQDESLPAVTLGVAIGMLIGGIAADGALGGPRSRGQFIRTAWLQPPAYLGALLVPASVALLWFAESSASEWAASIAVLAFAVASAMLKRSVWLTVALGSASLAIGMFAANTPGTASAVVWSALGLIMVIGAPVAPKPSRDDLAGIGHTVGAIGFAYASNGDALVISLCAWALGWLIGVTWLEIGGPSVSSVLERSSTWWDASYESWTVTGSRALPPVVAVVATTAATLAVVEEYVEVADARMAFGVIIGLLGFVFAAVGAHLTRSRLTSIIFGWAGLALAAGAILVALPEKVPIALTATLGIGTRLVVARLIPDVWLSWVAWLLPTVVATSLASELGMSDDVVGMVPVVAGGIMLLGGLFADEIGSEPRASDDFIRHKWLVPPSVLGAVLMLIGLGWLLSTQATIWMEAATVVALAYAAASFVLRRSIWLTSALGSIGLALLLEIGGASSIQSASVWAVLGLVVVGSVPVVKGVPQDELAAIGHLLGAVAFAYSLDTNAYLISITAWALGWLVSVAAAEIGWPTVSDVFLRMAASSDDQRHSTLVRSATTIPPLLAVATSTTAVLSLYDEFAGFDEARTWTAAVLAGLGLLFGAGTRFVITTKPARPIFGWSAIILAASALAASIGEDALIIAAASAFIGTRILLVGAIPHTWLSWPAWVMPIVISMVAGHLFGVPYRSVYLLSLSMGVVMLIGSLVFDDIANARRSIGEGLRTPWLRYPFVIGLLVVPFSLAPVFALDTTTIGVASLAAAAGYATVAVLIRAGSVTFPAFGLATFGIAVLLPWSSVENPSILIAMAAAIVIWSLITERMQSQGAAVDLWTRWDLPALTIAHLIVGAALLLTLDAAPDPTTWITAGALSMAVGVWRKGRWWLDAGLVLIVVGGGFAGEPWLLMALAITTARGMYGVWRDTGIGRYVDHGIAVAGFLAGWADLAIRFEWTHIETASYGSMTAGIVTVLVAALSSKDLVKKDTFVVWSGLGALGVGTAALAGFGDGPWAGIGIALVALSSEQWARIMHPNTRYATPVIAVIGWFVGLAGLGLSDIAVASYTVAVFGVGLAIMMPIADRAVTRAEVENTAYPIGVARSWAFVFAAGMVAAGLVAVSDDGQASWWLVAAGSAFATLAVATGGRAVGIARLRSGTGIPALGALVAALLALNVPRFGIGVAMAVVASISTLLPVLRVSRHRPSEWIEASVITGIAATTIAVPIAISEYPATELIVLILIAIGGQAIAYGIVFKRQALIALGPPMLGFAALALSVENLPSSTLWYAVPIAMVMLAEADILHPMLVDDPDDRRPVALLILEWSGVALIGLSPLVEMFRTSLIFGLVGFALAVGLMAWAILTKVKRRVLAACIVATSSTILSLAAAAASNVQDSAAFWIIGGGIGFSIMLIAGSIEAYRSRSGALMRRLGDLMEDWE